MHLLHDLVAAVERRLTEHLGRQLDAIARLERRMIDTMSTNSDRFATDLAALSAHIDMLGADLAAARADAAAARDQLVKAHDDLDADGMVAGLATLEASIAKMDALHAGIAATPQPSATAAPVAAAPVAATTGTAASAAAAASSLVQPPVVPAASDPLVPTPSAGALAHPLSPGAPTPLVVPETSGTDTTGAVAAKPDASGALDGSGAAGTAASGKVTDPAVSPVQDPAPQTTVVTPPGTPAAADKAETATAQAQALQPGAAPTAKEDAAIKPDATLKDASAT